MKPILDDYPINFLYPTGTYRLLLVNLSSFEKECSFSYSFVNSLEIIALNIDKGYLEKHYMRHDSDSQKINFIYINEISEVNLSSIDTIVIFGLQNIMEGSVSSYINNVITPVLCDTGFIILADIKYRKKPIEGIFLRKCVNYVISSLNSEYCTLSNQEIHLINHFQVGLKNRLWFYLSFYFAKLNIKILDRLFVEMYSVNKCKDYNLIGELMGNLEIKYPDISHGNHTTVIRKSWNAYVIKYDSNHKKQKNIIVKLPLSQKALKAAKRNIDNIKSLCDSMNSRYIENIPSIVEEGKIFGQHYYAETMIDGKLFNRFASRRNKTIARESLVSFIEGIHNSNKKITKITRTEFNNLTESNLKIVIKVIENSRIRAELYNVFDQVAGHIINTKIPLLRTHGDLWQGNVLFNNDYTSVNGIIDWDTSEEYGWPMLDILHFYAHENKWFANHYFGNIIISMFNSKIDKNMSGLIDGYVKSLNFQSIHWKSMVVLYWLQRVTIYVKVGMENADNPTVNDRRWVKRNIIKTIRYFYKSGIQ